MLFPAKIREFSVVYYEKNDCNKNSNVYYMYRSLEILMFIYIYLPSDNNILTMQNHNVCTDLTKTCNLRYILYMKTQ